MDHTEELACIREVRTGSSDSEIAANGLVEAKLGVVVSPELVQAGNIHRANAGAVTESEST